ncbi:hypothetical protein D910_08628 [Dendroctonus ponderosae]|uniref:Uncharacterized protein n=1 Tax=Dendroctonus ponderosae TaxID=77166 RepID=U4UMP1_DENPD|nr:hypothetical protein D910_08628 [Dendroctonus ponderosae]
MMPYMLTDQDIRKYIGFSLASAGDREGGRKSRPFEVKMLVEESIQTPEVCPPILKCECIY